MNRKIIALLPAAGIGSRMQATRPKQYLPILGKTLLEHTLDVILSYPLISEIVLVVNEQDPYLASLNLFDNPKIKIVNGGTTRAESVLNGLKSIQDQEAWVLVHDAARPCVTHQDLDKLLQIEDQNGAILAIPATDTIKRANVEQRILQTEDRSQLWQAQTPQFFPLALLTTALEKGLQQGMNITDEASAMELSGFQPHLVLGRKDNIKVTQPEDLALVEFYLQRKLAGN